jgi:hypothetical protein
MIDAISIPQGVPHGSSCQLDDIVFCHHGLPHALAALHAGSTSTVQPRRDGYAAPCNTV